MKGTIVKCLEDLVKKHHGGPDAWKKILDKAGMPNTTLFLTNTSVPDADVMKLIQAACAVLNITAEQAMEAFGVHWSHSYAPEMYGVYFSKAKNAREFLLNLDQVHSAMTKNTGATPPHFTYEWKGDRELIMHYSSARGLVALMPGLIKGVGIHFKEKLDCTVEGNDVHVKFAA
jgi:hypothetical protein